MSMQYTNWSRLLRFYEHPDLSVADYDPATWLLPPSIHASGTRNDEGPRDDRPAKRPKVDPWGVFDRDPEQPDPQALSQGPSQAPGDQQPVPQGPCAAKPGPALGSRSQTAVAASASARMPLTTAMMRPRYAPPPLQMHTPSAHKSVLESATPRMDSECACGCPWSTARATAPSPGRPTPGVVKQDKSSGGSVDTTKTRSGPQRVRMSGGERPIGAARGKQSDTEALCHPPPPPPRLS